MNVAARLKQLLRNASIRKQIIFGIVGINALLMFFVILGLVHQQKNFLLSRTRSRVSFETELLARTGAPSLLANDIAGISDIIKSISKDKSIRLAMLTDTRGFIIMHTDASRAGQYLSDPDSLKTLRGPAQEQIVRENASSLLMATPVLANGKMIGWAWVLSSLDEEQFHIARAIRIGIEFAVGAISLGMILALLLSDRIHAQLKLVLEGAHRLSKNQLKEPIPITTENEIGTITRALNHAMEKLALQQEALQEAVAARDEFFSLASHELKTPITSLKLRIELIERQRRIGKLGPEALSSSISVCLKQTDRMIALMEDLLNVSRIRSRKLGFEFLEFDLSETIDELLERKLPDFSEAGCVLEKAIEPHIIGIWDRLRIEQMAENLISNALKYGKKSTIHVRLRQDRDHAVLIVRDHGIGIPPDKHERIFSPFERAVAHHEAPGLGLGLFVVNQIVSAHSGTIELRSEEGQGAEFTVRLPRRYPLTS